MTANEVVAELAQATKEQIAAVVAPLLQRIAVLESQLAEVPAVDVIAAKAALLVPKPADGKDAPAVDVDSIAAKAAALVPQAVPGKDGRDGQGVDMSAVTLAIEGAVTKAVAALPVPTDGRPGRDGASVDEALVRKAIAEEVARLPVPRDGRDVDAAMLETIVSAHVAKAVSSIPGPKDGASVTLDDVAPLVAAEVTKAVSALPKPVDGVGLSDAVISRDGDLVLTFSDGRTKTVGVVVGANADPAEVKRLVTERVDAIPRPKDGAPGRDGADGLGFDDLDVAIEDEKGVVLRFSRGAQVKEFRLPVPLDAGVYKPGELYRKGAVVTAQGSLWIAQADTRERPGDGSTSWRLSVKKGRDGRDRTGGQS